MIAFVNITGLAVRLTILAIEHLGSHGELIVGKCGARIVNPIT